MIKRVLKKIETYLQTDIRYLVKGGGSLMLGQIGVSLIGLATATAFANLLPKDSYGTYQYILTTAEFLTTFTLIGLSRAVVTSTARGKDGTLDFAFKQGNVWGIGAILLGLGMGVYYIYKGNLLFGLGIAIGTACTLLIANAKIYISFLNGKKLFGLTSTFTVLGLFIPGCAVILALFFTDNLFVLIAAYFVSNTAINLILFLWSRTYKKNDDVDSQVITQSLHLSAQGLIGRVTANIDRILLFQFAGPIILAEFLIAQNIQRNFSHLFKSANGIVLPKLTVRSYAQLQKGLPRKLLLLYAVIIPFTLGYILVTPLIIKTLFPLYISTTFFAQVLGVLFLFLPPQILADALVGHGMNKALYHVTIASSIAKLLSTITLVPFFGMWGILLAVVIEQTIYTGLVTWYFFTSSPKTTHEKDIAYSP